MGNCTLSITHEGTKQRKNAAGGHHENHVTFQSGPVGIVRPLHRFWKLWATSVQSPRLNWNVCGGPAITVSGVPPCILHFQLPNDVFQHDPFATGTTLFMQFCPGAFM